MSKALGKRLKRQRVSENLSLRQLEKVVGVSFSSLARLERGDGVPTDDVRERVERWLERGEASPPRIRAVGQAPWHLKIEARLTILERLLGVADD